MAQLRFGRLLPSERIFLVAAHVFLVLFAAACLFPFLNVLAKSFSPEFFIQQGVVWLWPVRVTLNGYQKILQARGIILGFRNSVVIALVGTTVNILMSSLIAYPLSRRRLPLRRSFVTVVVFTMLFPTGLIPMYILVKSLGLINSLWALILPYAITTFNMIIVKNYFQTIPDSLEESAFMDGAGELRILFRIFLPLSKPVIAAVGLFYLISNWNIFMPAVLFLTSPSKYTIQVVLRDILTQHLLEDQLPFDRGALMSLAGPEAIQAAVTIAAMVPILIVYPFIQGYFTKGIMIGSVKG